jgi:hypothetical protein
VKISFEKAFINQFLRIFKDENIFGLENNANLVGVWRTELKCLQ